MASGMEMLMKSFGVDPVEIQKGVDGIRDTMLAIKERLDTIDARQSRIENATADLFNSLTTILKLMTENVNATTRSGRTERPNGPDAGRDVCDVGKQD